MAGSGGRWRSVPTSGRNATRVGASANVVVGILARNSLYISFVGWLRSGIPTALASVALCVPYLLIRYV
jgi:Na+/H+ antiporter NhaD/arsenite permease-like protein